MKMQCDVVADLLPLYVDGTCSNETKILIEQHISECEECKAAFEYMSQNLSAVLDDAAETDSFTARQLFKKIRRRSKRIIAIAVALCLALTLIFVEFTGGIALSNIGGVISSQKLMDALVDMDYEKAFSYLDVERQLQEIKNTSAAPLGNLEVSDLTGADWIYWTYKDYSEEEFRAATRAIFTSNMEALNDKGIHFTSASYDYLGRKMDNGWIIFGTAEVANQETGGAVEVVIELWYSSGSFVIAQITSADEQNDVFQETADALNYFYSTENGETKND